MKTIKIIEIKPNPRNPRLIKDDKFLRLCKSLNDFPAMLEKRPVVVNEDGVILGGNMRYRAAKENGWKEIPVEVFTREDASKMMADRGKTYEEICDEFVIKDNSSFGEWDWEILANQWDTESLKDWGLDIPDFRDDKDAEEDDFEVLEGTKTDIVAGDIFEIGNHRLMCGDSTSPDDVEKLMNDEKADMVFTDPPYGVNLKGGKQKKSLIMGDLTQTAIPFAFELSVVRATKPKAHFYFCGSETNLALYQKLFDRYLHSLPKHLIWVKDSFVMKQNGYHAQFEIIYFGYKQGSGDLWFGGRKMDEASDVWQVKRDAGATYLHPTQKPIALASRAIKNSSDTSALIYEPFGGSGSTLAAAHQLDRRCFAMQLDPVFCQVIIDRMKRLDPSIVVKKNGVVIE